MDDVIAACESREERLIRLHPDQFAPDFLDWWRDNRHIWRAFDAAAEQLARNGVEHFGARAIGEHIRFETALRERGGDFKVNDHAWPDCARLWLLMHPSYPRFFETRAQRNSSKRAA